jgi:hypothetical protein
MLGQPTHYSCWFVIHGSIHYARAFQLPQVLSQNLDGHAGHCAPKLAEPEGAVAEPPINHGLPAARNHVNRRVNRTLASFDIASVLCSAVLEQPGIRISPGRHYFACGSVILACFDPRADGDAWDSNSMHTFSE